VNKLELPPDHDTICWSCKERPRAQVITPEGTRYLGAYCAACTALPQVAPDVVPGFVVDGEAAP
jgi:hypothetical protein